MWTFRKFLYINAKKIYVTAPHFTKLSNYPYSLSLSALQLGLTGFKPALVIDIIIINSHCHHPHHHHPLMLWCCWLMSVASKHTLSNSLTIPTLSLSLHYSWWRSIVVRPPVLPACFPYPCARLTAGHVTTLWVKRPLSVSQQGRLSLPSLRGRLNE